MLSIVEQQYVLPSRMMLDMEERLRQFNIPTFKLAFSPDSVLGFDSRLRETLSLVVETFDRLRSAVGPLPESEAMEGQ